MNRTKITLIAGLVALFIVGGLLGFLGDRLYMERKWRRIREATPEQRQAYILQKYTRELHLTEQQQAVIQPILKEKMEKFDQAIQRHKKEHEAINREYDDRIKAVLTPEQQQLLDDMRQRIQSRWKKDN